MSGYQHSSDSNYAEYQAALERYRWLMLHAPRNDAASAFLQPRLDAPAPASLKMEEGPVFDFETRKRERSADTPTHYYHHADNAAAPPPPPQRTNSVAQPRYLK
jgi:hypothetical protein